jgi:dihydrofolate reductase
LRRVILQQFVTVDNLAAGPNGETDFVTSYAAKNDIAFQNDAERFLDSVDTMFLGANTYKMFVQYWPEAGGAEKEFAHKLNSLNKVVASNSLQDAPWGRWSAAEVTQNPVETLRSLKQRSGKAIVIWGSLALVPSLFKAGLIDEVQLRVCPTVLGQGKPLFNGETPMLDMKLLEAKPYDEGMVLLRYEPHV